MIIVTGANGQLGRGIVEQLLARVPAATIGVSVRDPAKAEALAARGVRVRQGDFEDKASLAHAFEGATRLLMVSSNARAVGADTLKQHRNAIAAARTVGARRILYTSHLAASATSAFFPMHDHAATEALLADAGVPFTLVRNGFYASTALRMVTDALASGELIAPPDGKVSWTTQSDLAEAIAVILADAAEPVDGPTAPLTASAALDLAEVAAIASELTHRTIRRVVVSDEESRASMIARGLPAPVADLVGGIFVAARRGEFAATGPTMQRLLGRPPQSMRDVLAAGLPKQA